MTFANVTDVESHNYTLAISCPVHVGKGFNSCSWTNQCQRVPSKLRADCLITKDESTTYNVVELLLFSPSFQSDGLAYSILPNCGVPPAHGLFQLLRKLQPDFEQPPHASLQKWAVQGVFLFNITLVSLEARK